jgi:hypothetical protein
MRLPIMRKQEAHILSLPDLSGGLNMRDGISEVLDNQLTDCKNMWWKDGLLRTRAAMIQNDSKINLGDAAEGSAPKIRQHNCYNTVSGIKGQLCSVVYNNKINFFWNYGKSISAVASIAETPSSYFVCQYADTLYCFTNKRVIYKTEIESAGWTKVEEKDYYTPLIATSCKKIAKTNASTQEALANGVMIEGFNILSDYYKMSFNSYNPEIVTEENQSHDMRYHIAESIAKSKYKDKTVTAVYTKEGVDYTHTVVLNGESNASEEGNIGKDGLKMKIWRNSVSFWDKDDNIAKISEGGENDLIITAPYITSTAEKDKIFGMKRCEWFGGGTAGLSGGTRLFLCGNTKKGNSDLVVWSGLNNPLYFPENSYFNVGNETGAVTGFGKQSDKLIIFKENETWFTQYAQNTNITAQDLINQNVIDYASSSVYFPLTQINSNIGCLYPDTIQLCRNRLVWLGNNDSVYTLVSDSQYNERSIFSVSEMVSRKIEEIGVDSKACACDWNGYYCLLLGNNILLMDYNCYGYTHVASYSKQDDANIHIPWYSWEITNVHKLAVIGNYLSAVNITDIGGKFYAISYYFNAKGTADKLLDKESGKYITSAISSSFTTKIFDFGLPHRRKNIEQINLQIGNNGGVPINLFFVTENGTEQSEVIPSGNELNNYTAGYIDSRAVFPCIKQVLRFGIKAECKGTLAVDSVILKYRTLGGAR